MINSRAMPVPLTRSYQRVAGTAPQPAPATTLPTPWAARRPRRPCSSFNTSGAPVSTPGAPGQYTPFPRKTADQVFQKICRSRA